MNSRTGALCSIPSGAGHLKQEDWHVPFSSQNIGPVWGTGGKDEEKRHIPSLIMKLDPVYTGFEARMHFCLSYSPLPCV